MLYTREKFGSLLGEYRVMRLEAGQLKTELCRRQSGVDKETFDAMEIERVLTAPPTEVKRCALIQKSGRIYDRLNFTPFAISETRENLEILLTRVWQTDETHRIRSTPVEKPKRGLAINEEVLWHAPLHEEVEPHREQTSGNPPAAYLLPDQNRFQNGESSGWKSKCNRPTSPAKSVSFLKNLNPKGHTHL